MPSNKVRTANYRAIVEWQAQIDAILERFDGHPPEEWHELLGYLQLGIGRERELIREIDELEASGWAG